MDSQKFIELAQLRVSHHYNAMYERKVLDGPARELKPWDFYVVWSVKVLQNNKALLSAPLSDGKYYEVTYNGDKNEMYVDCYTKVTNLMYAVKEEK